MRGFFFRGGRSYDEKIFFDSLLTACAAVLLRGSSVEASRGRRGTVDEYSEGHQLLMTWAQEEAGNGTVEE